MNDFFANIYELWGFNYIEGLSDDLYSMGVYGEVFLYSLIFSLLLLVIYYKVLDQPRFSKVLWWILFFGFILIGVGFIAYEVSGTAIYNLYADQGQDVPYYEGDFFSFTFTNVVVFGLVSFIASLLFKFFSTNHKYIPF